MELEEGVLHPRLKSLEIAGKLVWWFVGVIVVLTGWSVTVHIKLDDVIMRVHEAEVLTKRLEMESPTREAKFQILDAKLDAIDKTLVKIDRKINP